MENLIQRIDLIHDGDIPLTVWDKIQSGMGSKDGITLKLIKNSQMSVFFPSYLYSKEHIVKLIQDAGFKERVLLKKNLLQRLLDKLVAENQSTFGGRKLDCCDLNK
ncbi:MAG: LDCC motif putative metal-binding protein [Cyclobacteriaceae bacterium]